HHTPAPRAAPRCPADALRWRTPDPRDAAAGAHPHPGVVEGPSPLGPGAPRLRRPSRPESRREGRQEGGGRLMDPYLRLAPPGGASPDPCPPGHVAEPAGLWNDRQMAIVYDPLRHDVCFMRGR